MAELLARIDTLETDVAELRLLCGQLVRAVIQLDDDSGDSILTAILQDADRT